MERYDSHLCEVGDALGCLQLKAEIDSSDEATILTIYTWYRPSGTCWSSVSSHSKSKNLFYHVYDDSCGLIRMNVASVTSLADVEQLLAK